MKPNITEVQDGIKNLITVVAQTVETLVLRILALKKGPLLVVDLPNAQNIVTTVVMITPDGAGDKGVHAPSTAGRPS
jgi:hypothetical protein